MQSVEFEHPELPKVNLETIRNLRERLFIKQGSPLWWSTDYTPDPREYIPFGEFQERLVHLGNCKTTRNRLFLRDSDEYQTERDVYLYPHPTVPMTIIDLDFEGQSLPFLVTARPYHQKELQSKPFPTFVFRQPLDTLPDYVSSGGVIKLPNHFYPHVRGLFAGRRGDNFFWYSLRTVTWWGKFGQPLREALDKKGLQFIELYDPKYSEDRTYSEVWDKLIKRKDLVDTRSPRWVNFEYDEVSAEEFIEDFSRTDKDLLVFYPIRAPATESTLPLVITSRTHKESPIRKPVVLGIYAENGLVGRCRQAGILRIKDRQFAQSISQAISQDFGVEVDTVLFTPQKGQPRYERV